MNLEKIMKGALCVSFASAGVALAGGVVAMAAVGAAASVGLAVLATGAAVEISAGVALIGADAMEIREAILELHKLKTRPSIL